MKRALTDIVLLVVVAIVLGVLRNSVAPGGIEWVGDWAAQDAALAESQENPEALPPSADETDPPFLTLPQAVQKYGDPNVIFVDAREPEEFEAGHIAGSVLLPFDWIDDYWPLAEPLLPLDKEIVTYCSGAECELSLFLARYLRDLGYTKISIFYGGWRLWEEGGHPTGTGMPAAAVTN